jgi:hypothetical protein
VAAMMYWSVAEQAFWSPSCNAFRLKSENIQLILMSYRYLEINTTRRVPLVEQELLTLFEDTKGVIRRIHISKKNRQHNGQMKKVQKDKQRSTKHYTEN